VGLREGEPYEFRGDTENSRKGEGKRPCQGKGTD
jgi:hypothetical protein